MKRPLAKMGKPRIVVTKKPKPISRFWLLVLNQQFGCFLLMLHTLQSLLPLPHKMMNSAITQKQIKTILMRIELHISTVLTTNFE